LAGSSIANAMGKWEENENKRIAEGATTKI